MQHSFKKYFIFVLTLLALTFSALGSATAAQAAPAKIAPTAEAPSLLQFASSGHILGFTSNGMYAATGSHALHVDFVNANNVQPQSASSASTDGAAAPLSQVTYANLWDGVTLTYNASGIYTTTYTVAPGADVKNIKLTYNAPLTLNKDGSLSIAFESGTLTESAPIAWQVINGKRVAVEVAYQIRGQEVAFKVGAYNPSYTLMIDPTLTWNTFLGGSGSDNGNSIAVDGSGNLYVTGSSSATWGSPVRAHSGGTYDTFAAKLNSSGVLQWNTFLGGSNGYDYGYSIAVDGSGNVYVAGTSTETWGAPVRAYGGGTYDAFAAKLNSSGVLQWNTFLGSSGDDNGYSIAIDSSGNVYVAGDSYATWGAPVRAYSSSAGNDAFAAKLNSSGALQWNTFLGGSGYDGGLSIAVDGSGNVYVAGYSTATWGAPVRAYSAGNVDAFAAKLNSSGALQWNTFLGNSGDDRGTAIAVDDSGNVYVAGYSIATWGAPVRAYSGFLFNDAFAAKLNSSGVLQWNTFLGGDGTDYGQSIAVDGSGNVYVAGFSDITWGTPVQAYSASFDAFAAQLNSTSGVLQWNTFLGGSGTDYGYSISVDGSGNVYVAGWSSGATWGTPVHAYSADADAFVAVLAPTYTVTFDKDGGTGTTDPITSVAYNATVTLPSDPTKSGYTFGGWYTALNGGGTQFTAATPVTADITVYAKWTLLPPTLGAYSASSILLSNSTTITPSAAPTGTTGISVYTSTDFKGTFIADPASGVVKVINAHPAGVYTVIVKAFGAGGSSSTTFDLTVNSGLACIGTPGFSGSTNISVGVSPYSVALGDFNNDGMQDFAAANASSGTVSIRLGDGAGNFSGTTNVSVGAYPTFVAAGDFNNDGKQDIASANYSSNTVSIRLGDGASNFSGITNISVGSNPYSVTLGDFNNDGNQDFATANYGTTTVSIRLGDGTGNFSGTTNVSVGSAPVSVAVGDFNNDGKQDFAASNQASANVSIRIGDGAGNFSGTTNISVENAPYSATLGDFNNDGNQDFATANTGSNTVSIRLGDGTGNFSGTTNVSVGNVPRSVALGDFNNDGNQDFVAADDNSATVSIRLGDGAGNFSGTTSVSVGSAPKSVTLGDFNNDGKQDLATANFVSNSVSIRLGGCFVPVTYNGNGNTGGATPTDSSSPYNTGSTVTVLSAGALVKTGYTFNGWNTAADGSGTSYAPAATFSITNPVTLYAQWTANNNTITFNGNGSTGGSTATQTLATGATAALTANGFSRTGYTFAGWATSAGGAVAYADGANYTMGTANVTLYAKWTADNQTLTFNSNGGTTVTAITQAFGTSVSAPTAPTKSGYTFAGWYNEVGLTTPYTFPHTMGLSTTIYAKWTADNQTLTFNSNGGTAVTAITQAFGTSVSAPTVPTKSGYTFAGWYNEVGLTTPYTFPHTMGLSTTIYAKWTADSQTLTFNSNGGTAVTAITQAFGTSVSAPTAPTKAGYTFAGWYNEVGLTTPYTFPHTMGLSTTIYAKWTADSQTLTFESNGGSAVTAITQAFGTSVSAPTAPTKSGYTFAGWYNEVGLTTPYTFPHTMGLSITIYAKWTVDNQTLTFESNGGTAVTAITQAFGTSVSAPTDPTKNGYTFAGWYNEVGLTTPYTFPHTMGLSTTIYAKWTTDSQTLTFESNGGTAVTAITQAFGTSVSAPTVPTKSGYTFAGWYNEVGLTTPYTFPHTMGLSTTIYAKWTADNQTLTFNSNGGTAVTAITQAFGTSVSAPTDPTKSGYTFAGWYNEVGLTTPYTFPHTMGLSTTIYAKWTADNQTLTFNSNGGTAVTAITQDFGTSVSAPADPTRMGYTFGGWYNEVGLTTTYTFPHTMGLSTTIYAKWTADSQTLTFNSNGGSLVTAITQDFGTSVSAPADPTRTGYTFGGWYNEVGLTTTYTFPHTMGLSTTIYAKWTVDNQTLTFESNGGTAVTTITQAFGTSVSAPTDPTKSGYTFAGWYNEVGLTTPYTFPHTMGLSTTIYAKWTEDTYTVTFDKDGGTGTTDPITGITYNATVTLPSAPTKAGNTFGGWYTALNGGGTQFTAATPVTANITVYAKWTTNVVITPIFVDVPYVHWANNYIERLYLAGITSGCTTTPLNYCPDNTVTRAQMAVFLLKGIHGSSYAPPAVGVSTGFGDVATNYWAAAWIKQLAAEGITSGCGNGNYCPDQTVTRAQMAVFLLKAKYGSSYTPPAVGVSTGFNDVATNYWAAAFIKQLVADSITSGCGSNNYCPDSDVTRAQMAVFLVKTFNLP